MSQSSVNELYHPTWEKRNEFLNWLLAGMSCLGTLHILSTQDAHIGAFPALEELHVRLDITSELVMIVELAVHLFQPQMQPHHNGLIVLN